MMEESHAHEIDMEGEQTPVRTSSFSRLELSWRRSARRGASGGFVPAVAA